MKALLVSAAAIGLLSAAPAFAQAGPTATANGTADAQIVSPISVNPAQSGGNLNFGRIAADSADATVTIAADGGRTSSAPNVLIMTGSSPAAAHFDVGGQAGLSYTATTPATTTLTDGTTVLTADLVQYEDATAGYTLDSAGHDGFIVGGTLHVPGGTNAGSYHGSFVVSVQYN